VSVPLSYTLFEILGIVLFIICAIFRIKKKDMPTIAIIMELLAILAFGMTLEILAVLSGSYSYPPFNLMLFNVPLIIGIGWSVILFTAMWLTDSFKMPEWSRIFVDAFLALLIDLNMDAVAIRDIYTFDSTSSGMWAWRIPLDTEWFGVPWSNFAGWWLIIVSMSTALRLTRYFARKQNNVIINIIYPIIAYFIGNMFLFLTGMLIQIFPSLVIFLIQMALSLFIIAWKWREANQKITLKTDLPIFLVPISFHASFLSLLLIMRYYVGAIPILVMSCITFILHMTFLWISTIRSRKVNLKPKSEF
jgi:uncharacterized membrane protein